MTTRQHDQLPPAVLWTLDRGSDVAICLTDTTDEGLEARVALNDEMTAVLLRGNADEVLRFAAANAPPLRRRAGAPTVCTKAATITPTSPSSG